MKIDTETLNQSIKDYLIKKWPYIKSDIGSLVKIPSYISNYNKDMTDKYPMGKETAMALIKTLEIAKKLNFDTKNYKNILGIADIDGKSSTQLGFLSHLDVVPAGNGWNFKPFELTEHNGYLIGRGVLDDKGPTILMLYAIDFVNSLYKKNNEYLPYSIRYIFGTDEETGMNDVEIYKKNFNTPKMTLIPDSDFTIVYGEKGVLRLKITSPNLGDDNKIKYIYAGVANNTVAGSARAIIQLENSQEITTKFSKLRHVISIEKIEADQVMIKAKGRSTHAFDPYKGIDAIGILIKFLNECNIGNARERKFLKFLEKITCNADGSGIGIKTYDKHLKDLTITATKIRMCGNKLVMNLDSRVPLNITAEKIQEIIKSKAPEGSLIEIISNSKPFVINPKSKIIKTISKSYIEATDDIARLTTSGGSTYAKKLKNSIVFGPEMPWIPKPAFIGEIHGPDEGESIANMKRTFKIFVFAILAIMKLDLNSSDLFL